ncbi:hypothetical protein GLOTRDRAFT_38208 [Gloeophyllum trabeum ATCC 11539]|uniref:T-complex 11 n=1 Tax=Gloeophyllum trabeum (strain ATCC 11539 / FP-39264 / Madison 617) TaxID=670483 RepID=S7RSB2_GLOTA|nr:uncharacterized protein GLOTRDRAFT_38208 [Gloeophyllum trabeum ATCC 11539]EPQ57505.1 hypothetical protein GLOTRDRAFT_38208 [Gloeophyllum trabeum ATCC 11539]
MVARPRQEAEHQNDQVPSLRAKVEDIVHRAFWDEALEALSNPTASSQVHRLQALYKDLYDALKYILPSNHPVLATLGSPLSPTSSPLLSAITHLREVVTALRERCAPARDQYIDELLHRLDDANPRLPVGELANIVVEVVKSILKFTEVMKDDLAQFVLGTMGEKQLRAAIREEARRGERQLVIEIWGEQRTQELWIQWVSAFNGTYLTTGVELGRHIWIPRLVEALGSVIAVSSPELPINDGASEGQNDNVLPPPLFVSGPSLLYVQNYLQALVIAAALRSLTRLPPSGPATENTSFMDRVWALLKAEIDGEPGSGGTKLINLADEVVRARKSLGEPLDAAEEEKLRAAVKRTLQIDDPVYVLLQKRLLSVITTRLVQSAQRKQQPMAPAHLQSGRERPGKRPRLVIDDEPEESRERTPEGEVIVKGFEDPVLVRAIGEAVGRLRSKVEWTREVWHDLTDGESVAGTQTYQGT